MGRSRRSSLGKRNFGLAGKSHRNGNRKTKDYYSNWFWESKSQKKIRQDQKRAETERMRAETQAMQQLLSEQDPPNQGANVGQIALVGGLLLLVAIGAIVVLNKKGKKADPLANELEAEDLIV